jgi:hypothetical protein
MPETLRQPFAFSQSSLQDYADCPRRFQLRYIKQVAWPAVESEPVVDNERRQIEGQLFHRLVQQFWLGLPAEKLSRLTNSPDLQRWWENFIGAVNDGNLSALKNNDVQLHTEATISAPLGAHRLLAKYDLIAIAPDQVFIFDWKTYAKRPREEWMATRWQTRVYRSLLAAAGSQLNGGHPIVPERIEMIYWFADYPNEPVSIKYSSAQFKRDWSAVEKVADEISSAKDFPMTDDEKLCRFCAYRSYCNRGAQAGTMNEAEMESEAAFDVNFEQISEIEF